MTNNSTDTPRTDAVVSEPCAIRQVMQKWEKIIENSRKLERELSASEAEVESLRHTLGRALEIADEFWDNQKQAVLVYHQELADELDQINLAHRIPRSRG